MANTNTESGPSDYSAANTVTSYIRNVSTDERINGISIPFKVEGFRGLCSETRMT